MQNLKIVRKTTDEAYQDYREYIERAKTPEEIISRGHFEEQFKGFKKFAKKLCDINIKLFQGLNYIHMTALNLQDMMVIPVYLDKGDIYIPLRANAMIDGRPIFLPILGAVKVSGYKYYTTFPMSFNGDYKWKNATLTEVSTHPSHEYHVKHIKDILKNGFKMKISVIDGDEQKMAVTNSQLIFFKINPRDEK